RRTWGSVGSAGEGAAHLPASPPQGAFRCGRLHLVGVAARPEMRLGAGKPEGEAVRTALAGRQTGSGQTRPCGPRGDYRRRHRRRLDRRGPVSPQTVCPQRRSTFRRECDRGGCQVAMKVGSLFAGIGGFDLAADRVGMEVAWQSEIDPHASRVLAHHWPDVPNLGDIHDITEPPTVDVLTGGFPCQDYSVAG